MDESLTQILSSHAFTLSRIPSQLHIHPHPQPHHSHPHFPQGLFVDILGTVYVADSHNNRIIRWPKGVKHGTLIVRGHGKGEGVKQLNTPWDWSFDRYGSPYVVDCDNNRVQRFSIEKTHKH
jgi:DNA-binding beta-propeller fold protein YncE